MFKQISMTNFKSWRQTGPVRLAPLTGFFGENSSGKSSLLQLLLLLKQTAESNDRNLVLKTGSLQAGYVNLGTPQEIIHGTETAMSLSMVWDLDSPLAINNAGETVKLETVEFETKIHATSERIYVDCLRYQSGSDFSATLKRHQNNQYTIRVFVQGQEPRRPQSRPRVYMKPVKMLWLFK